MAENAGEGLLDRILKWMKPSEDEDFEEDEEWFEEHQNREGLLRRWLRRALQEETDMFADLTEGSSLSARCTKKIVQLDEKLLKKLERRKDLPEHYITRRNDTSKTHNIDEQKMDIMTEEDFSTIVRETLMSLLGSTRRIVREDEDVLDASELEAVKEEAYSYMKENPDDKEFLLFFAYIALDIYLYTPNKDGDRDLFDIKKLMKGIVSFGCEKDFFDYIKHEIQKTCEGAYVGMTVTALRMIQELREEKNVEEKSETLTERSI